MTRQARSRPPDAPEAPPRPAAAADPRRPPGGDPTSDREQQRRETAAAIKAAARDLLAPHRGGELSLRAVARAVGIAPSGIYRYFASRQELVQEVARDAYASASSAHAAAMEAHRDDPMHEQALALAHAYRRWALEHRAEFSLLFASEGSDGSSVLGSPTLDPFFAWPLGHFHASVRAGAVDLDRACLADDMRLADEAERQRRAARVQVSPREASVMLAGWSALHGHVAMELHGALPWFLADPEDAFDRHARGVLAAMGHLGFLT